MRKVITILMTVPLIILGCGGRQTSHQQDTSQGIDNMFDNSSVQEKEMKESLPKYNIYIESSGSMDGYVKGNSDFKLTLFYFLTDLLDQNVASEVNLNYINSSIDIRQRSATKEQIELFIRNLSPTSFHNSAAKSSTTNILDILRKINKASMDANVVSVLISDMIISPGKANADDFLALQSAGIKTTMVDYNNNHPNNAICLFQFMSGFDGNYYNRYDTPTPINAQRPYYMLFIGEKSNINGLLTGIKKEKYQGGGIKHSYTLTADNISVPYAVIPSSGNFKLDKENARTTITKLGKDSHNEVKFAVQAEINDFLLDDDYICDVNNWVTNSGCPYNIDSVFPINASQQYTHQIRIKSERVKKGTLKLKLLKRMPTWIVEANDTVGVNIHSDGAMDKTYGIKYIVDGIFNAFTKDDNNYTNLEITIK